MRKYDSMEERLIANSVQSETRAYNGTACWEWIGRITVNRSGMRYGTLNIRAKRGPRKGKTVTHFAHRVALKVFKGRRLTTKSVAKHLCNNTLCINPEHLVGGTQKSNVRQCVREGRHVSGFSKAIRQAQQ